MDLDVLFVGTAGSAPTARRGLPATLVRRGGDRLLFDCGEGTQRQLLRSVGLLELEEIFISHFHADHFLGLPGMLKTFGLRGREQPLAIYGPPGLRALYQALLPVMGRSGFEVRLVELAPNEELERDGYRIAAFQVDHRVSAYGYALVEDHSGELVTSAGAARRADAVSLRFHDGRVPARVVDEQGSRSVLESEDGGRGAPEPERGGR